MNRRPRRLRSNAATRDLVAETHVDAADLITPLFIIPGARRREAVDAMPGVERLTVDLAVDHARRAMERGLRAFLLFGLPSAKDPLGHAAADSTGPVPQALRAMRKEFGRDALLFADVCLCAYTDHGHCGVPDAEGHIQNDASLPQLAAAARAYADAGADWVAPSDMMDGRVAAIRTALDAAGHERTSILSYSAKYASGYYGPFREAAHSAPAAGDRKTYQMDPRNVREALREVEADEAEGADAVMVKPALAYLDVVRAVRAHTTLPLAAYNVSGEYSMVKAAEARGWIDEAAVVRENLIAMRRAGADWVITYHGLEAVEKGWLK